MLETLADLFYDPLVFWGLPIVIAAALALRRHRRGGTSADGKSKPGNE